MAPYRRSERVLAQGFRPHGYTGCLTPTLLRVYHPLHKPSTRQARVGAECEDRRKRMSGKVGMAKCGICGRTFFGRGARSVVPRGPLAIPCCARAACQIAAARAV